MDTTNARSASGDARIASENASSKTGRARILTVHRLFWAMSEKHSQEQTREHSCTNEKCRHQRSLVRKDFTWSDESNLVKKNEMKVERLKITHASTQCRTEMFQPLLPTAVSTDRRLTEHPPHTPGITNLQCAWLLTWKVTWKMIEKSNSKTSRLINCFKNLIWKIFTVWKTCRAPNCRLPHILFHFTIGPVWHHSGICWGRLATT